MTTPNTITQQLPITAMSKIELQSELAYHVANKNWRGRYFEVDRRLQEILTAEWVCEDVFGHTFST